MPTQAQKAVALAQDQSAEEKIKQLRELFANAPEVGKRALENVLQRLTSDASKAPPPPVESAGRIGSRGDKVSELTIIVPFAPGGAERLRAFLRLFGGNLAGADEVGTVHDMRFRGAVVLPWSAPAAAQFRSTSSKCPRVRNW